MNKLSLLLVSMREPTYHGRTEGISAQGCYEEPRVEFGLWLGSLGESPGKWGH